MLLDHTSKTGALCGIFSCGRRQQHAGCHTPEPPYTTVAFDYDYEATVVRHVMRGIRAGKIDPAPEYLKRWMEREVACGLR